MNKCRIVKIDTIFTWIFRCSLEGVVHVKTRQTPLKLSSVHNSVEKLFMYLPGNIYFGIYIIKMLMTLAVRGIAVLLYNLKLSRCILSYDALKIIMIIITLKWHYANCNNLCLPIAEYRPVWFNTFYYLITFSIKRCALKFCSRLDSVALKLMALPKDILNNILLILITKYFKYPLLTCSMIYCIVNVPTEVTIKSLMSKNFKIMFHLLFFYWWSAPLGQISLKFAFGKVFLFCFVFLIILWYCTITREGNQ